MDIDLLRAALPTTPDPELAASARRPFLADHAVQALAVGRAQPGAAGAAMAVWFRRTRRLGSKDRRRVAELAYGVIRHEHILRAAAAQAGGSEEDSVDDARLVDWLGRVLDGDRLADLPSRGPAADFATALSLPPSLTTPWLEQLGPEEAAAFAAVMATRAPLYLRVNLAWGSREAAAALLAEDDIETEPVGAWGLVLVGRANVAGSRAFKAGAVEVQDLSSQRVIESMATRTPLRDARVLDLCAGAGGKSLALAALGARVQAWDTRPRALAALDGRARRAGVRIEIAPPEGRFEVVLIDAPCSGSGRLRREPALRLGIDPQQPVSEERIRLQRQLIGQGAAHTESGGLLAYATCSLVEAENGSPLPPPLEACAAGVHWPHRGPGDGFSWLMARVP